MAFFRSGFFLSLIGQKLDILDQFSIDIALNVVNRLSKDIDWRREALMINLVLVFGPLVEIVFRSLHL